MAVHRDPPGQGTNTMSQLEAIAAHDEETLRQDFLDAVLRGLSRDQKTIPPRYFYDHRGSKLFDEICEVDEYYPTRTELSIFRRHIDDIVRAVGSRSSLIEYGAGSSTKIRLLLDHLKDLAAYIPIDISGDYLEEVAQELAADYPELNIQPVCADFTQDFEIPEIAEARRRVVFFPGSTIGNMHPPEASELLSGMADVCGPDGGVLIGVDLKKDPDVLEAAYDDSAGVTGEFNLNLLRRINRELDGDFDESAFRHRAKYNDELGRVEMHLVSEREQEVQIADQSFEFAEGESIHTECSYKYTTDEFAGLAAASGLAVSKVWRDSARLFSVQFLKTAS